MLEGTCVEFGPTQLPVGLGLGLGLRLGLGLGLGLRLRLGLKLLSIITQRTKNHTPRFAISTKAVLSATCCRVGRSRMTVRWSARRRSVTDRLYQNDKHLVITYMSNGFVRSRNILSRRKNRR